MAASKKKKSKPSGPGLTARSACRHTLYEASVQDVDADIQFINRVFLKERRRKALLLREDFCGTARLCASWAVSHPDRLAVGLDLHQPTMDWGIARHIKAAGSAGERVKLLCRNVIDGISTPVDVTVAFNFSYCALQDRAHMLRYFKRVFQDTVRDGAFFLDIHGGTESFEEMEESTRHRGFRYVWDQGPYDPVTGHIMRYIHFEFPDGTRIRRAFSYDWRMWTLPELKDLLTEAGFAQVDVYWEGSDAKGAGNGVFRKVTRATNEASWIAYIVAWREPTA